MDETDDKPVTRREFDEYKHTHSETHAAVREALSKAEIEVDKKFEQTNKFREQIAQERSTFVERSFYDERHEGLARRITELEKAISNISAGGRTANWMLYAGLGVVGALIAVGTLVIAYFALTRGH